MGEKVSLKSKSKDKREREPIKAQPETDKDGGILTSKIAAIVKKIKNKLK